MKYIPTIRCSSLPRILKCAHSAYLPQVELESEYAKAGTEQHKMAESVLKKDGKYHYRDLSYNTQLYVDYVCNVHFPNIHIEKSLSYSLPNGIELTGTPDCALFIEWALHIVDLKTGHQPVDPNNPQMLGYALLALNNYDYPDDINVITLNIIQDGEVKSYRVEKEELELFESRLIKSLSEHTFETGDHCNWCQSKPFCQLMNNVTMHGIDGMNHKTILQNERLIKSNIEQIKAHAMEYNPDWFDKKERNIKKWKDGFVPPQEAKFMSPARALAKGLATEDDIDIETTYIYKVKK